MQHTAVCFKFRLNPFHATGPFRYPLKTSENLWFSDVFREVSKETSGTKWVKEVRNLMKNPEKPNPALKQKFSKNQLE